MENDSFYNSKEIIEPIISNVKNICRICLGKNSCMVSLFSNKEDILLFDMFSSVTSIKVHPDDGLPIHICEVCENDVVYSYQFRTKCRKSHTILMSKIKIQENDLNINEPKCEMTKYEANSMGMKNSENKIECMDADDIKIEIDLSTEYLDATDVEYLEEDTFEMDNVTPYIVQNSVAINKRRKSLNHDKDTKAVTTKTDIKSAKKRKRSYMCSFCSKKFLKAKTLKLHIKQKHGKARNAYPCGQCKESFSSEQDLHIHSALHIVGDTWTCNQCHKEFEERVKFRRHVSRHMSSKRHACDTCGKQFVERSALRRHVRVHTGEPRNKNYQCHMCDKRFSDSTALSAHMSRHTGLRPCTCDTCGKTFPTQRLLASHTRVHSESKPHKCLYCEKRFRHESTLSTHHRTHTGDKPYVCSVCGKRFIQNSNLTLHMRTHTGEKPYSCDTCGRKFSSGTSLGNHSRTHTGEKPYECPVCGKRFARMYLSAHMRQHTGVRPYECCACHKRFAHAARLREHYLVHTGERAFECGICSEKFKTKAYLSKHLKNHEMIKNLEKKNVLILEEVNEFEPYLEGNAKLSIVKQNTTAPTTCEHENNKSDIKLEVTEGLPVEGHLILPNNGDMKTKLLVIDQGEGNICLAADGVKLENNDVNCANNLNLVTVNEGEVNIASAAVLEGTTVKLYQLDQSLVQIHTSGGQVTISKITSKVTANF